MNITKFRSALTTNATSTSFTLKVATATEPTGDAVHDLLTQRGASKYVHLMPYGLDGNNDTFDMRLWGWNKTVEGGVWIPYILADLSLVVGNIAATALLTGAFMVDTITLNKGIPAGVFSGLLNTANDTPAGIVLHTLGAEKIEFAFDLAGAQEGVSMNCLWRVLDDSGGGF
jgi:hypothetical protein